MIIHIPTGKVFENRKEAKREMGRNNYEKANRKGEFTLHCQSENPER